MSTLKFKPGDIVITNEDTPQIFTVKAYFASNYYTLEETSEWLWAETLLDHFIPEEIELTFTL